MLITYIVFFSHLSCIVVFYLIAFCGEEEEDAEGGMDVARGERAGRAAGLCVAQPVYHSTAKDGGHIVSN